MNCDYVTKFDDVIVQGAVWARTYFWKNPDGTPVILRGASARLQIRPYLDSPKVLLDLSTANGGLTIKSAAGSISKQTSGTITGGLVLPPGIRSFGKRQDRLGIWDLVVTIGTNSYRLYEGIIDLSLGVTR